MYVQRTVYILFVVQPTDMACARARNFDCALPRAPPRRRCRQVRVGAEPGARAVSAQDEPCKAMEAWALDAQDDRGASGTRWVNGVQGAHWSALPDMLQGERGATHIPGAVRTVPSICPAWRLFRARQRRAACAARALGSRGPPGRATRHAGAATVPHPLEDARQRYADAQVCVCAVPLCQGPIS